MPAVTTSPNVDNYYIGKGHVSFKSAVSGSEYRSLGNVPKFEFVPKVTKLDHFSSQQGIKRKDKSIVLQAEANLVIVLDEWTPDNLKIAFLGDIVSGELISIFSSPQIKGSVKFEGNNDIGPRIILEFPICTFATNKAINPLSDQWGQVELDAEVLADESGHFGTCLWTQGVEP